MTGERPLVELRGVNRHFGLLHGLRDVDLEVGVADQTGRHPAELSGGQQQRVAVVETAPPEEFFTATRTDRARDCRSETLLPGISYATARRRYESGTLPVPAYRLGRLIMVGEPVTGTLAETGQTVVYARVSSADPELDLDRQVARVTVWASDWKLGVDRVVTETGSALDGHRKRFGAEYVDAALTAQGRRLLVADPAEIDDALVRDVTEILTSLYVRLYGRRAAANRARRAVEAAEDPA